MRLCEVQKRFTPPFTADGVRHVYHIYAIRVRDRDEVMRSFSGPEGRSALGSTTLYQYTYRSADQRVGIQARCVPDSRALCHGISLFADVP